MAKNRDLQNALFKVNTLVKKDSAASDQFGKAVLGNGLFT